MKRIFIGGLGRSGTTIALNIFYHHPDCFAVPIETKFLVEEDGFADLVEAMTIRFSPPASMTAYTRFTRQMRAEVTGEVPSKYGDLHQYSHHIFPSYNDALDRFVGVVLKKRYFPEREPLISAVRAFVQETFDYTAAISNKNCWAEKTPANIWRFDFLRELFPDCYFIHMIRNPLDVYYSLREKGWLSNNLVASLVDFEGVCAALAKRRRRLLADPRFIEIKLEDLVDNPTQTMQKIFRRCDLPLMDGDRMESVINVMNRYYAEKEHRISRDLSEQEWDIVVELLQPWAVEFGWQGMR